MSGTTWMKILNYLLDLIPYQTFKKHETLDEKPAFQIYVN